MLKTDRELITMKYEDFLFLDADEDFLLGKTDFLDYFNWHLQNGFSELQKAVFEAAGMKHFPKRTEVQAAMGSIATSPKDLSKKLTQKQYYSCNGQCAYLVITRIFNEKLYENLKNSNCPEFVRNNYAHILKCFLLDIMDMANAYQVNIMGNNEHDYNIGHITQPTMPFHQILRQNLFGQFSFHSFSDMEISYSVSIIRQLIELRIRRAFGVICFTDSCGSVIPINFSQILSTLKYYQDEIEFPLALGDIERIYVWSNMYVHSGLKDFSWIPYSLEYVLRPLTFGERKQDKSWSMDNGIKASKEVLDKISQSLLNTQENKNLTIMPYKPECELRT